MFSLFRYTLHSLHHQTRFSSSIVLFLAGGGPIHHKLLYYDVKHAKSIEIPKNVSNCVFLTEFRRTKTQKFSVSPGRSFFYETSWLQRLFQPFSVKFTNDIKHFSCERSVLVPLTCFPPRHVHLSAAVRGVLP